MPPHSSVSDSLRGANVPPSLHHLHSGDSDSSGMGYPAALLHGGQHFDSNLINNITSIRTSKRSSPSAQVVITRFCNAAAISLAIHRAMCS